jgi:hypothetical protein
LDELIASLFAVRMSEIAGWAEVSEHWQIDKPAAASMSLNEMIVQRKNARNRVQVA